MKICKMQILIIVLLISLSKCADKVSLELDSIYNFSQPANQKRQYSIKIIQAPKAGQKLFVSAQTPYNDPFEQPYMKISSSQNFTLLCDDEASSYTGICEIEQKQLKKDRQFMIQISCLVDCQYRLAAYTSNVFNLGIGKSVQLSAMQTYGLAKQIQIDVPQKLQYSSIIILAELINYDTATQGFNLLVNYGKNATTPSTNSYMLKGIPTYGHRLNVQISKQDIKPGDKISIYIFLGINNTVQLTSIILDDGDRMISVGNPLIDFTVNGQVKKYVLDLTNNTDIQDKDILIKCIIYSGSPDIKVSFDQNFTDLKTQDNWFIDSSIAYLLTPALRKQKGFNGHIYIKATSFFSASYYLQAIVNKKPFIVLENQVMQLVKIPADKLQNFIYEDQNYIKQIPQDGMVKYKTTIQMMDGSVEVGIRDCDSLMKTNQLQECLIKTIEEVQDQNVRKTFDNIQGTMKRYFSQYVITFDYNVSTCPKASVGTFAQRHICDFHVLFINKQKNPKQVYLGVQVSKYSQIRQLKQGITSRDTVTTESTNFYSFQLHSIENITKLQIYTTVIQGDVALLVSRNKKYVQLRDVDWTSKDIAMSINGNMVIQGKDLTVGVYYISVYGYQISDYIIGIAIQRVKGTNDTSTNNTDISVTQIKLIKGVGQTFTMPINKTLMKFVFTPTNDKQNTLVSVESITGDIQYDIKQKNKQQYICSGSTLLEQQDNQCSFISKINTDYIVSVYGYTDEDQTFVITYSDDSICQTYPINFPLYIQLDPMDKDGDWECFVYTLYVLKDIEITVAMSQIDKVRSKDILNVSINFGDGDKNIVLNGHQIIIDKSQLQNYCKPSNTSTNTNTSTNDSYFNNKNQGVCRFQLKIALNVTNINKTSVSNNKSIQIMIAVQGYDDENVLFDGIPQRVVSKSISTSVAKQFYYFIYDANSAHDLTLFLTSQTQSTYQLSARVISTQLFSKDLNGTQYAGYNSVLMDVFVVNSSELSPITILNIPKDKIARGSAQNEKVMKVVLITVYGIQTKSSQSQYIFRIQATQSTTYLSFGQSKIGYVDKDQLYQYQIQLQSTIPSIVSVRSLGIQKCMKTYIQTKQYVKQSNQDGTNMTITVQFNDIKSFNTQKGTRKIIVKGITQQVCTYQISYNSIGTQLKTIIKLVPYQIDISNSQISYYLYNHKQNTSFYIIAMVDAGNGLVYAHSIPNNSNETVQQILNKNINSYTYIGQQNSDVFVNKSSKGYCTGCYYVIAIKGKSTINGQLVIVMQSQPIPLKQGSILKDRLAQAQSNIYQFYSSSTFTLKLTTIYGRVNVLIQTPAKQKIIRNNLTNSVQIAVPVVGNSQNIDYFDPNSRYIITVTGIKDVNYFIGIGKKNQALRVYEGMPVNIEIKGNQTSVQFTNIDANASINLLVEDTNYDKNKDNILTFTANQIFNDGTTSAVNAIQNQTKSQGSYNIKIKQKKGDFILKISPSSPTNVTVIYAKMSFTHLIAGRSIMLTNPSIFQIFSPGDSIMIEIFSCKGDIQVIASSNYTKIIQQDNQGIVRMQHANYGGHYVISAENLKGEYFVLTKPLISDKQAKQQLQYIISYYLYSAQLKQKMPYKILGIRNTNVQYNYKKGTIDFRLNKVYAKDNTNFTARVVYNLYISNQTNSITQMTKCSLGTVYTVTDTYEGYTIQSGDIRDYVTFSFKNQEIKKVIGSSSTYFVGAQASVTWDNPKPHHVKGAYFTYGISQLLADNQPEFSQLNRNTNFVLLWIVVPFLLGAVVLYLAARYFIRSLRYQPSQLIEQEDPNSHQQFGSAGANSTGNQKVRTDGSQKKTGKDQNSGLGPNANKYDIE